MGLSETHRKRAVSMDRPIITEAVVVRKRKRDNDHQCGDRNPCKSVLMRIKVSAAIHHPEQKEKTWKHEDVLELARDYQYVATQLYPAGDQKECLRESLDMTISCFPKMML
jgi:hypothetical protein